MDTQISNEAKFTNGLKPKHSGLVFRVENGHAYPRSLAEKMQNRRPLGIRKSGMVEVAVRMVFHKLCRDRKWQVKALIGNGIL